MGTRRINPKYPPTPKLVMTFDAKVWPYFWVAEPYSLLSAYLQGDTQGIPENVQMVTDRLEGARRGVPVEDFRGEVFRLDADRNTTRIQYYRHKGDIHEFPTRIVLEAAKAWLAFMKKDGRAAW